MSIIDIFTNPLILTMFAGALVIGALISVSASLLGVTLVLKKYSMLGDGLAHIGFGSMAVAALCDSLFDNITGEYSLLISVPIVIAAALLIMRLGEKGRLAGDSAIALVSTSALAIGYIIYKYATGQTSDVCSSMFGSASLLTPTTGDYVITFVLSALVIGLFFIFYNKIFSVTFDENFAAATGTGTGKYKTLISILVALVIVLGMKMLGTVMISGIIVFPALSAMRLFKTFKSVTVASIIISSISAAIGILLAFLIKNMPIGPCVVLVNLFVFIVFSAVEKIKTSK